MYFLQNEEFIKTYKMLILDVDINFVPFWTISTFIYWFCSEIVLVANCIL